VPAYLAIADRTADRRFVLGSAFAKAILIAFQRCE
jgi:hypothetical protein